MSRIVYTVYKDFKHDSFTIWKKVYQHDKGMCSIEFSWFLSWVLFCKMYFCEVLDCVFSFVMLLGNIGGGLDFLGRDHGIRSNPYNKTEM